MDDDRHGDGREHERPHDRDMDASQPPKVTLSTVNVGQTQSQIISAS
jgi:hypothetical protein